MRAACRVAPLAAGVLALLAAASVDQAIDGVMRPLADVVTGFIFFAVEAGDASLPLIVLWLVAAGVFFTVYLGYINVRGFGHAVALVRGKFADPNDPGEISQFQALTTAVSGTVGIGNIAGVAVAISLGGPGATFWLIVAGLLGMSTKFVECTLGVMYRGASGGETAGGPMYYLKAGLERRGWPVVGRGLGACYAAAIFITVTGGADSAFADRAWVLGLAMAIAVGLVIIGGIRSIAATTGKLVPAMAGLYVVSCIAILLVRADALPGAIAAIVAGAFSPEGVAGGVLGVMILGFRRAVFSNEAGLGSASTAHSTARTHRPVSEGYVALLEPFIDTVVIMHHDRARDRDHRVRSGVERSRDQRDRTDDEGICERLVGGSGAVVDRRDSLCLLDDDRMVLLRSARLHLSRWRLAARGAVVQAGVPCLRRARRKRSAWCADRFVRCAGLHRGDSQHHRALHHLSLIHISEPTRPY